jgi:hypothetical protein
MCLRILTQDRLKLPVLGGWSLETELVVMTMLVVIIIAVVVVVVVSAVK